MKHAWWVYSCVILAFWIFKQGSSMWALFNWIFLFRERVFFCKFLPWIKLLLLEVPQQMIDKMSRLTNIDKMAKTISKNRCWRDTKTLATGDRWCALHFITQYIVLHNMFYYTNRIYIWKIISMQYFCCNYFCRKYANLNRNTLCRNSLSGFCSFNYFHFRAS